MIPRVSLAIENRRYSWIKYDWTLNEQEPAGKNP